MIGVALNCGYDFVHQQIDQWMMSQYMTVANFRVPNMYIVVYESYFSEEEIGCIFDDDLKIIFV